MLIANHFEHKADAGFVRSYDARSARRQFQVSVALILILGMAAFALGFLVRLDQPAAAANSAPMKTTEVDFAKTLLDIGG